MAWEALKGNQENEQPNTNTLKDIAKLAEVKTLLLGHYSTRYGNIDLFRTEANEIFENVLLADDGLEFEF